MYKHTFLWHSVIVIFVWDEAKNHVNKRKHGVSFEEAETVFLDDSARLIADPDHSDQEDRFVLLGMSSRLKLLIVIHVYLNDDQIIRIISARKATSKEQMQYKR